MDDLLAMKGDRSVSVVIPARNEIATIAGVVRPLVDELLPAGLVDEVLVVDGRSTDGTAQAAHDAGARVLSLPESAFGEQLLGKGGALWWSQAAVSGDLVVFLDADVLPSRTQTVVALLTPLLRDEPVQFVKAAFDRPLTVDGLLHHGSGGRVTELLARPLINAWWPALSVFVQPLAGELAATRELLASLPFASGFGLELAMLIDVLDAVGAGAMAQADIGERRHRHHSDAALGRMSAEVLAAAFSRQQLPSADRLVQFARGEHGFVPIVSRVTATDLPPMATVLAERTA